MRSATQEERESVDNYIKSKFIPTGVTFNGALHGQIKNVTEKEKIHRLAEYDFPIKSKLDCIKYIDGLLESTKSTDEIKMLKSISYYLKEFNGQFILEPWCVLHDGGEYPYVGQVVCCYNAIGEETTMVYNPDGDPNYEWMYNGQKILAWCPDPLNK